MKIIGETEDGGRVVVLSGGEHRALVLLQKALKEGTNEYDWEDADLTANDLENGVDLTKALDTVRAVAVGRVWLNRFKKEMTRLVVSLETGKFDDA